jgi:hypothetical protein
LKPELLLHSRRLLAAILFAAAIFVSPVARAQDTAQANGKDLYDQIKAFSLSGRAANVKDLCLHAIGRT